MHTETETASFPFDRTDALAPPSEYELLRGTTPTARITLYNGTPAWLLTRYEDVKLALTDHRFSADARNPGFPFVSAALRASVGHKHIPFLRLDPPEHDRLRRMLSREFIVKRIDALRPAIEAIVDRFIDQLLAAGRPADLISNFALPIPSAVIAELLGVPYSDHEYFQERGRRMLSSEYTLEQSAHAVVELREYLGALAERKRAQPGDDVLSRLVIERELTGELDREDLKSSALLLLVAGHETTANMIGLGVYTLLRHPEQHSLLRADGQLIKGAVEELLRFLSVVHTGVPRVALEDVPLEDTIIRRGEGVIASIPAANWDPSTFPEPQTFDIRREPNRHLAFGFGIHQCLGQPLARKELEIALTRLFDRVPTLELAGEHLFGPEKSVYGLHQLQVTW
ncbi:cytochrome P450 [Rhodococcus jostii]|uniref:Cytochrome P450 n=1 Tax=Rhodococcus jostii TaxID=132919 RepID=A0ABU4CTB9_RHOJO|nr:cytochrome P450 [Rhodococcus jostii]MDV6286806.1 cytochrome P450 [Rhodococcus jostii]